MKFAANRPYTHPEAAARKLIEIAASVETVQDGRIYGRRRRDALRWASSPLSPEQRSFKSGLTRLRLGQRFH
jgi:hypothetical protein